MDIIVDVEKLSVRADEIDVRKENKELRDIAVKLKNAVREHNLLSLAAPQIGIEKRVFVINFNGDIRTFVNPMITSVKGFELSRETCSSIPGKSFIRPRHNDIRVMYQTPLGKIESKQLMGAAAKVFQHCLDHLDGLLLSDIGLEVDEMFDNATEEERAEVLNMYLDSLDIKQKEIDKEIQEDEELKQIAEGIDFIEKVQKGEVQIERVPMTEKQIEELKKARAESESMTQAESDNKSE
jgi:peptide deformylase